MGKADRGKGQGSCRALRKAIYGLVNSENVITVDNPDDHDPATVLEIARDHLVGRVQAQADRHGWGEHQTAQVIHCLPRLVRLDLPAHAMVTQLVTVRRGRKEVQEHRLTGRVRGRSELALIPVQVSLEPGFRDRLDRALTEVAKVVTDRQLNPTSVAASSATAQ